MAAEAAYARGIVVRTTVFTVEEDGGWKNEPTVSLLQLESRSIPMRASKERMGKRLCRDIDPIIKLSKSKEHANDC